MRYALPLIALTVAAAPASSPTAEFDAAMAASAEGWNAGSLDQFVAIYAPDATFVGKDALVQGRAAIADRYRPSFADGGNKRGKLGFDILGHRVIGKAHVLLWALWRLQPSDTAAKAETGMTTLLFERRADGWKIISDHSS